MTEPQTVQTLEQTAHEAPSMPQPAPTEAQKLPSQITSSPSLTKFFDLPSILKDPNKPWSMLFLGAFIAGVLVSFTPCVYPMIPITATILQAHGASSLPHQFIISSAYVTGMATIYAGLGYLSATTGTLFGSWMGNIWFLLFIMLFFLYCAGAMFGLYDMYTPQFLMPRNNTLSQSGSVFSAFVYGLIAGTFASPCLTPALSLLLGFVSRQGNPLLGLGTLFFFALGMGLLLILVGTSTSFLSLLPNAGGWMEEIKKVFGFLLVAMAFSYTEGLIDPMHTMMLYAALALFIAGYYFYSAYSHHCFARARIDVSNLPQPSAPRCTLSDWVVITLQLGIATIASIQLYSLMQTIVPVVRAWLSSQGF
jgi:thiol:disulfide interchange protein